MGARAVPRLFDAGIEADAAFNDKVLPAADENEMFGFVAAHQNQAPGLVDLVVFADASLGLAPHHRPAQELVNQQAHQQNCQGNASGNDVNPYRGRVIPWAVAKKLTGYGIIVINFAGGGRNPKLGGIVYTQMIGDGGLEERGGRAAVRSARWFMEAGAPPTPARSSTMPTWSSCGGMTTGSCSLAAVRPLALWERLRWRQTGASPFGVALRTADVALPIDTWPYAAAFLSPGKSIPIVTAPNAGHEPLIFAHPGSLPIRPRRPQAHRGKHRRLTRVAVSGPAGIARCPQTCGCSAIRRCSRSGQAPAHLLELDWDGRECGRVP